MIALCNAFRPPLIQDTSQDEYVAARMLSLVHKENGLQERAIAEGWVKKIADWVPMDMRWGICGAVGQATRGSTYQCWPKSIYTLAVYQLKQAVSSAVLNSLPNYLNRITNRQNCILFKYYLNSIYIFFSKTICK